MLRATPRRALLEANLAACLWLSLLFALAHPDHPPLLRSGVSFAATLVAIMLSVRTRRVPLWREMGLPLFQSALLIGQVGLLSILLGVANAGQYLLIASVGTWTLTASARLLIRFWFFWNGLRQRYFLWSLTHAHLIFVESTVLVAILCVLLWQSPLFVAPEPQATPLLTVLDYVISLEPFLTVGGILTFLVLLLVLPPSALFSYLVSRRLVRRLVRLDEATARLEQGDYAIQIPVEGQDEIARLQARYNAMTRQLRETISQLQTEQATVASLLTLQREMVANISHDLRTPLATLQV